MSSQERFVRTRSTIQLYCSGCRLDISSLVLISPVHSEINSVIPYPAGITFRARENPAKNLFAIGHLAP